MYAYGKESKIDPYFYFIYFMCQYMQQFHLTYNNYEFIFRRKIKNAFCYIKMSGIFSVSSDLFFHTKEFGIGLRLTACIQQNSLWVTHAVLVLRFCFSLKSLV